jgi:hypothetical protein
MIEEKQQKPRAPHCFETVKDNIEQYFEVCKEEGARRKDGRETRMWRSGFEDFLHQAFIRCTCGEMTRDEYDQIQKMLRDKVIV